jgi:acyl transferase domain-containing protein
VSKLFLLAGDDELALSHRLSGFANLLQRNPDRPLATIVANTAKALEHEPRRFAAVADTTEQLAAQISAFIEGKVRPGVCATDSIRRAQTLWVFPGHGMVSLTSGQRLAGQEPVFKEALTACEDAIERTLGASGTEAFGQGESGANVTTLQLRTFALQVALAALWRHWGVAPDGVLGHSLGEVAAAHVAGTLALDDAVRLVAARAALLEELRGCGGMITVDGDVEAARAALSGLGEGVSMAARNSPKSIVLSGEEAPLRLAMEQLGAAGFKCHWLADAPGHGPQIEPLLGAFEARIAGLAARPANTRFYSSVSGVPMTEAQLDIDYWRRNLRQPVLFADALERALADGFNIIVELSAQPILLPAISLGWREAVAALTPSLRGEKDERTMMLRAAARLYAEGVNLRGEAINGIA